MSKERMARLALVRALLIEEAPKPHKGADPKEPTETPAEKQERENQNAGTGAVIELAAELLNNIARIADALETMAHPMVMAPMGKGTVVGELAQFEQAIDPAVAERIATALEHLAAAKVTA